MYSSYLVDEQVKIGSSLSLFDFGIDVVYTLVMNTLVAKKTVLNVKMDKDVKEKAQQLAHELGLNLSLIVNASLKQFVERKEILFSKTYTMTPYLENVVRDAQADYKAGKNISPIFSNVEDAFEWLEK